MKTKWFEEKTNGFKIDKHEIKRKAYSLIKNKGVYKVIESTSRLDKWLDDPDKRTLLFWSLAELSSSNISRITPKIKNIQNSKLGIKKIRDKIYKLMKEDTLFAKIVAFSLSPYSTSGMVFEVNPVLINRAKNFIRTLSFSSAFDKDGILFENLNLVFLFFGKKITPSKILDLLFKFHYLLDSDDFFNIASEAVQLASDEFIERYSNIYPDIDDNFREFTYQMKKLLKIAIDNTKDNSLIEKLVDLLIKDKDSFEEQLSEIKLLGAKPIVIFINKKIDILDNELDRIRKDKGRGQVGHVLNSIFYGIDDKTWKELPDKVKTKLLSKYNEAIKEDLKDFLPDELLDDFDVDVKFVKSSYNDNNICVPFVKVNKSIFDKLTVRRVIEVIEEKDLNYDRIKEFIDFILNECAYLNNSSLFKIFISLYISILIEENGDFSHSDLIYGFEEEAKSLIVPSLMSKTFVDSDELKNEVNSFIDEIVNIDFSFSNVDSASSVDDVDYLINNYTSFFSGISDEIYEIYEKIKQENKEIFNKIDIDKSDNMIEALTTGHSSRKCVLIPVFKGLNKYVNQAQYLLFNWYGEDKVKFYEKLLYKLLKNIEQGEIVAYIEDFSKYMILMNSTIEDGDIHEGFDTGLGLVFDTVDIMLVLVESYYDHDYLYELLNNIEEIPSGEITVANCTNLSFGSRASLNNAIEFLKQHEIRFHRKSILTKINDILQSDTPIKDVFKIKSNHPSISFIDSWLSDVVYGMARPLDISRPNTSITLRRLETLLGTLENFDDLIKIKIETANKYYDYVKNNFGKLAKSISPVDKENISFNISFDPFVSLNSLLLSTCITPNYSDEIYVFCNILCKNMFYINTKNKIKEEILKITKSEEKTEEILNQVLVEFLIDDYHGTTLFRPSLINFIKRLDKHVIEKYLSLVKSFVYQGKVEGSREPGLDFIIESVIYTSHKLYQDFIDRIDDLDKTTTTNEENPLQIAFNVLFPKVKIKSLPEPIRPIASKYFYKNSNRFINQNIFNLGKLRKNLKNKLSELVGQISNTEITVSFHPLSILDMNFGGRLSSCQSLYSEGGRPRLPQVVEAFGEEGTGIAYTRDEKDGGVNGRFSFCFHNEIFSVGEGEAYTRGSSKAETCLLLFRDINFIISTIVLGNDRAFFGSGRDSCKLY